MAINQARDKHKASIKCPFCSSTEVTVLEKGTTSASPSSAKKVKTTPTIYKCWGCGEQFTSKDVKEN